MAVHPCPCSSCRASGGMAAAVRVTWVWGLVQFGSQLAASLPVAQSEAGRVVAAFGVGDVPAELARGAPPGVPRWHTGRVVPVQRMPALAAVMIRICLRCRDRIDVAPCGMSISLVSGLHCAPIPLLTFRSPRPRRIGRPGQAA